VGELKEIARVAGMPKSPELKGKPARGEACRFSTFKFGQSAFWHSWSLLAAAYFFLAPSG
jgi:hypothetical protein